jgi:hypothetical protein
MENEPKTVVATKTFVVWIQLDGSHSGNTYKLLHDKLNGGTPDKLFARFVRQNGKKVPLPQGQFIREIATHLQGMANVNHVFSEARAAVEAARLSECWITVIQVANQGPSNIRAEPFRNPDTPKL